MRKIIAYLLMSFSFFNFVFAEVPADDYNEQFDLTSPLALQDVPLYEGIDEFEAKLDKIRNEEGREPLGLVLCGGSARAFAHIGVLRAFEEQGVVPDFIVANSMGAIIGMFYAYGFSPDKIEEIVTNLNLSSYFEPVFPLQGGVISVREYRALVNKILGKPHTDLSECPIPIVILTEDLETKRQIWHASGDFASIMTAAFAMPAIMEPTYYALEDGIERSLIDSGSIDIGGLKIADHFSPNLIISTAFYDVPVNLKNPIVVLNRTFSIGKERIAVNDIKNLQPVIVRNEVESFSFMEFDKSHELAEVGYESAVKAMPYVLATSHKSRDLSEVRAVTDKLADEAILQVKQNEPLEKDNPYWGIKLWPNVAAIDLPDYYITDKGGVSLFGFVDSSDFYAKFGPSISFVNNEFSADAFLQYKPTSVFSLSTFLSYSFELKTVSPKEFYTDLDLRIRPHFFPLWLNSFVSTAEYKMDGKCQPLQFFATSGFNSEFGSDKTAFLAFTPYVFIGGDNWQQLSVGTGGKLQTTLNFSTFSKKDPRFTVGIGNNTSARYAFTGINSEVTPYTRVYDSDFYRGWYENIPTFVFAANQSELYFEALDSSFTFAELFIIKQFKTGAFFDVLYTQGLNFCTGGFVRAKVSLIGLCTYVMEAGGGWNIQNQSPFGYFSIKTRM